MIRGPAESAARLGRSERVLEGSEAVRLDGKVCLITGAGSGIGQATALLFHREGARIVAMDHAPGGLERLPQDGRLVGVMGDVSKRADAEAIVATALERFGRLDILCNIAGIMDRVLPVTEVTDEVWDHVLAVNLTGPMLTSRAAIPAMLRTGGGVIVNISSVGGLFGARGGAAYVASKHGLIGLSKSIAATHGRHGIRCVAICPGAVETGIGLGGEPSALGLEALNRALPSNPRTAHAEEIAATILFCASDEASFVNGTTLVADGGWTAG